jgi:hypothetical protein
MCLIIKKLFLEIFWIFLEYFPIFLKQTLIFRGSLGLKTYTGFFLEFLESRVYFSRLKIEFWSFLELF